MTANHALQRTLPSRRGGNRRHSMFFSLAVEEHDPVGLDEAIQIADGYFSRTKDKFRSS